MKNLILSAAVILSLTFNAAAAIAKPVNDKAQKTFDLLFKDADNVKWSESNSNYEAFFDSEGIKTRVTIDAKGNLLQTIRYYGESNLPANVLYNVKNDYKGKEVFGVTEVTNKNGVNYRIVLKDDKHYTHINANNSGDTELVSKHKRGDK
ncbi:hypothetical protein U0035_03215 [Niabella yanshanensis]|uniref:Beta-lactamase-inhibitor-like PepSY-like domain-containing protein n=1 Tax=Niabella yanshanensis TaxID=577386 RepID=A0ABZ0W7C5_9BACT|nr:hypothetical protein [Niabella yanshanensis]WQD39157.1 hypothetical protein U0035_03215 [Niabella yanshanensis]